MHERLYGCIYVFESLGMYVFMYECMYLCVIFLQIKREFRIGNDVRNEKCALCDGITTPTLPR